MEQNQRNKVSLLALLVLIITIVFININAKAETNLKVLEYCIDDFELQLEIDEYNQDVVNTNVTQYGNMLINVPLDSNLKAFISEKCNMYGINENLVYAIMSHESAFLPYAVSETEDYGLMQINACHQYRYRDLTGTFDLLDAYANSWYGIKHLSDLYEQTNGNDYIDRTRNVLMMYQYGINGAYQKFAEGIYSSEFTEYVIERIK